MKKQFALTILLLALTGLFAPGAARITVNRIKDIASLRGARDNQLIGYGLVVGLNGTGDKRQTLFTIQSITSMLHRLGVAVDPKTMRIQNVAAVMVTATLPAFPRAGQSIDVTASSIGDAKSIQGGVLLLTPLKGMDGQTYAMAQGPLVLGGFKAGGGGGAGGGNAVETNHPTVGRVPGGAIVEREIPFSLQGAAELVYSLNLSDFTSAAAMARIINATIKADVAQAVDSRTVTVKIPEEYRSRPVDFISRIETLPVETDQVARIVIDEKTGTIILGREVKISAVAVMHGNLSVAVATSYEVSQPAPFSQGGTTQVVPQTSLVAGEQKAKDIMLGEGSTVDDLVKALNGIGATPRDVIAILTAMQVSGAIKAEISTM